MQMCTTHIDNSCISSFTKPLKNFSKGSPKTLCLVLKNYYIERRYISPSLFVWLPVILQLNAWLLCRKNLSLSKLKVVVFCALGKFLRPNMVIALFGRSSAGQSWLQPILLPHLLPTRIARPVLFRPIVIVPAREGLGLTAYLKETRHHTALSRGPTPHLPRSPDGQRGRGKGRVEKGETETDRQNRLRHRERQRERRHIQR